MARLCHCRPLGQRFSISFMAGDAACPAVPVDPHPARDCVNPREDRLAWPVGMSHPMDSHPGFLQQILCVLPAGKLSSEEAQQSRAQRCYELNGRGGIGLLISLHAGVKAAAGQRFRNTFPSDGFHLRMIRSRQPGSYDGSKIFFGYSSAVSCHVRLPIPASIIFPDRSALRIPNFAAGTADLPKGQAGTARECTRKSNSARRLCSLQPGFAIPLTILLGPQPVAIRRV